MDNCHLAKRLASRAVYYTLFTGDAALFLETFFLEFVGLGFDLSVEKLHQLRF